DDGPARASQARRRYRCRRPKLVAIFRREEPTMAKGTLIAAMNIGHAAEDEFQDWYDTEHLPERQRVPGFLVCDRWIGASERKISGAPGLPGPRPREPFAVVQARDQQGRAADAVRGGPDPPGRPASAGRRGWPAPQRDEHCARARGRVQRVV